MMSLRGRQLDGAIGGTEGIECIKKRVNMTAQGVSMYKLILLDYSMQDIDGPQIARVITELAANRGIEKPFICCFTAYSEATFKTKALESGMDIFLVKPMTQS